MRDHSPGATWNLPERAESGIILQILTGQKQSGPKPIRSVTTRSLIYVICNPYARKMFTLPATSILKKALPSTAPELVLSRLKLREVAWNSRTSEHTCVMG